MAPIHHAEELKLEERRGNQQVFRDIQEISVAGLYLVQHGGVVDQIIRREEIRLPFQAARHVVNPEIPHGPGFQLVHMQDQMRRLMGGHHPLFLLRLFTVDHHIADPVHQGAESPEAIAGIHIAELQDHAHFVQQFERIRSMKAYDALNSYLKYAAQKKMIPFNPMGTMKAPRPSSTIEITPEMYIMDDSEKALSKEETEKLRGILYYRWKRKPHNRRYPNGGAMDLILNTGLRMGEALALQWSDVNFEKKTLSVTKNLIRIKNRDGKGNKYKLIIQDQPKTTKSRRVIPLNAAAIAALEDLKTTPGYKPRGFIIHTDNGSAMEPRNFEATLGLMCKAAGIRQVGVHALRHTYATRLFEKGVDIKIISELLGHSSTEITYRIYVHVIESLKASAVEGLDLY